VEVFVDIKFINIHFAKIRQGSHSGLGVLFAPNTATLARN
jgi:hypothetical protein